MFKRGTKVRVVNYEHDDRDGANPNGSEGTVMSISLFAGVYVVDLPECKCDGWGHWIFTESELEAIDAA